MSYIYLTARRSAPTYGLKPYPIRYSFRFTSLVPPTTSEARVPSYGNPYTPLPKRLFIKKSYLLLSWLFYMTFSDQGIDDDIKPRLAVLPAKSSKYTLTKAPMAHKTNSKEQFLFKFYNFKFSFSMPLDRELTPQTYREGAYLMSLTAKSFPAFATNLLFLKSHKARYPISDSDFFSIKNASLHNRL